ncbi:MAG: ABC transporter ATP-binding protein [Chloroflexi bacterium]|nr:ABC transporter ATP-binding protein [Chloroflexota bacterium]
MSGGDLISTKGLSKFYGSFKALDELDLSVRRGEVYGFLGLNGAGKTTAIRLLCGLLRPSSGAILIDGEQLVWPDAGHVRRRIGYLPQSMRFHEAMDAAGIISFYCRLSLAPESEAKARATEMDIPLHRRASIMSPGQQRKLGLLLATIAEPQLLILDEPTAGLDPEGQREVRQIIEYWRGRGMTVFVSSHILGEVQQVCTSVGVLHNGRLIYAGTLESGYEVEVMGFSPDRWDDRAMELQPLPANDGTQRLLARASRAEIPVVISRLVGLGVQVYGVREQSLEDMFAQILGREVEPCHSC